MEQSDVLKKACISQKQAYLVDGEDLAVALLNLLELPKEVPAHGQQPEFRCQLRSKMNESLRQRNLQKARRLRLTRTCSWRGPRWWPRASCGRSWGAHRRGSAARDPPPGTDGTARSKQITQTRPRSAPTLGRACTL